MGRSNKLEKARAYEKQKAAKIGAADRPAFHLTPYVGWMNDPNGFSLYKGQYHLFYQYYPYDTNWGPMHWGHAVSHDLLHWEYLPCAMTGDREYDRNGVFSGSAIELPNGKQLLMYTGVREDKIKGKKKTRIRQTQCVAVGDGVNYKKYGSNPVITGSQLPEGASLEDFRDPKIVRADDGSYLCYVGSRPADGSGQILVYESRDGFEWKFRNILIENKNRVGLMWECPDVFSLDGKTVLLTSPQDTRADQLEGLSGNCGIAVVGTVDPETGKLREEWIQPMDYGIDFYAHQSVKTTDGRRVMIGWMQNWDACGERNPKQKWFGQMTLPRELTIRDGRILQMPIRELASFRKHPVKAEDLPVSGCVRLPGVRGRIVDLDMTIRPDESEAFSTFELRFAENEDGSRYCSLTYDRKNGTLSISRLHSGTCRALLHERTCRVGCADSLHLRVILDRFSAEIFVNDGEQTMTMVHYSDPKADGISFRADGTARLGLEKYDLAL